MEPSPPPSLDAARAEAVTADQLGASRWQVQAFRCAVFSYVLRWWVTEREAIDAVWNGGDWRELVAEFADEQLDLADRLTGEGDSPAAGPATGRRGARSRRQVWGWRTWRGGGRRSRLECSRANLADRPP